MGRWSSKARKSKWLASAALVTMSMVGCEAQGVQSSEAEVSLQASRQALVDSINGLKTVNGLKTNNGLKTVNGLKTTNGLKTINGLTTINGLSTVNGLKTINGLSTVNGLSTINGLSSINGLKTINGVLVSSNGLPVDVNANLPIDCGEFGVVGVDCWGTPDGLLNFKTGMMSSDDGIATAKYLVRCALPANETMGLVDYTGSVVRLKGEIGLAPGFNDGDCDLACQENISGCLMALTNGAGNHVEVELSSTTNALGGGHSAAFPYQEAVFYGNIFLDTPVAHFCVGKDYAPASWPGTNPGPGTTYSAQVLNRACSGYGGVCPYVEDNSCNQQTGFWPPAPAAQCKWTAPVTTCTKDWTGKTTCKTANGTIDTAVTCTGAGATWTHPITTYRKDKGPT
ncbi:MAG: hypothetical protein JWN04_6567 [Myxococcaceae bacterium]|nr:hypothetical protein [Myxococcaceae bacterium]